MKPKRNYKIFINDIWNSINKIEQFVKGMDFEDFFNDDKTVSAVIRKLEIIGEATKNIPEFIKQKYNKIHWKGMAGLRDKLAHDYSGIDVEIVWKTITKNIMTINSLCLM